MRFVDYVKNHVTFLVIQMLVFLVILMFMLIAKVSGVVIFLVGCLWFIPVISYMLIEYFKWRRYFNQLESVLEELEEKYLVAEVVEEPEFLEGQLFHSLLYDITKSMHENVNKYEELETEYREYIETWVHEIKTPIASLKLILENNESNVARRVEDEVKKVEAFIEQALYYARSNDVSKDYVIKEFELKSVVMKVIRQNSRDFILKKVSVDLGEIEGCLLSDLKWVEFIINQLVVNAIKYSKPENAVVKISSNVHNQQIILRIEDNGVGISEKDLGRVFDKGFTGENGRIFGKSTGMGLYLCQKLCHKLSIGIYLDSEVNKGTTVKLIFPQGNLLIFK